MSWWWEKYLSKRRLIKHICSWRVNLLYQLKRPVCQMYFCIWKVKTISVVRGQLFCGQCKAKFLLEYDCINDLHKVQSITDTDNEFTECQTPRKKLQSIGISPVSLHAFMKTLKSDISEAYKVQVDCLKIQSLILIIKMMWKRKWMTWLGCTRKSKKN